MGQQIMREMLHCDKCWARRFVEPQRRDDEHCLQGESDQFVKVTGELRLER